MQATFLRVTASVPESNRVKVSQTKFEDASDVRARRSLAPPGWAAYAFIRLWRDRAKIDGYSRRIY